MKIAKINSIYDKKIHVFYIHLMIIFHKDAQFWNCNLFTVF